MRKFGMWQPWIDDPDDPADVDMTYEEISAAAKRVGELMMFSKKFNPDQPRDAKGRWVEAYHGSGADFDQFDISKIGSGQGAQAYGDGIYFAENPDVAASYRQELGGVVIKTDGEPINPDIHEAMGKVYKDLANTYPSKFVARDLNTNNLMKRSMVERIMEVVEKGRSRENEIADAVARTSFNPGGKLYKVRLHVDPNTMLDWDKPLRDNPDLISKVVDAYGGREAIMARTKAFHELNVRMADLEGEQFNAMLPEYDRLNGDPMVRIGNILNRLDEPKNSFGYDPSAKVMGEDLYHALNWRDGEDRSPAPKRLMKLGVPGIRYLDQGSRQTGKGTHNYVIFDANLAEIVEKKEFNPDQPRDWHGRWTSGGGSNAPQRYLLPAIRYSNPRDPKAPPVTVVGRSHQDARDRAPLDDPEMPTVEGFLDEEGRFLKPDEAAVHASVHGLHDGSSTTLDTLEGRRRLKDEHLRQDVVEAALEMHENPGPEPGLPGHINAHLEPNRQDTGRAQAQLSWEAAPGMTTGIFPEFHKAPLSQRREFQKAVEEVIAPGGQDLITKEMGLRGGGTFAGVGVFEGRVNPGAQTEIDLASFRMSPRDIELLNGTEAIRGKLLHQDAAAWHRPSFDPQRFEGPYLVPALRGKTGKYWLGRTHNEAYANMPEDERVAFDRRQDYDAFRFMDPNGVFLKRDVAREYASKNGLLNEHGQSFDQRDLIAEHLTAASTAPADRMDRDKANMLDFRIGRPLTAEEATRVSKHLSTLAGGFYSPIATKEGFRLLNIPEVTGIANRQFQTDIIRTLDKMKPGTLPVEIKAHMARADSGYIDNDWKAHPNGENYDRTIDAAGPYVRGVADKVFADLKPKLDAVYSRFAKRYGWTGWPPGGAKGFGRLEVKTLQLPETFWLNGRRYEYAGRIFFKGSEPNVELASDLSENEASVIAWDFDVHAKRFNPDQRRDWRGRWVDEGNDEIAPAQKPGIIPVQNRPFKPVAAKLIEPYRETIPHSDEDIQAMADRIASTLGVSKQLQTIRLLVSGQVPTNKLVSEGGHQVAPGVYSPEREHLHRQILGKIFSKEKVKAATPKKGQKPTLVVIGGRGGSGKSFVTDPARGGPVDPSTFIKLDADEIKAQLRPDYKGWNAFTVHEESSDVLERAVKMAKRRGLNLIVDETMKTPGKAQKRIEPFKAAGYNVDGYYVFATPEEACKRAITRYIEGKRQTGEGRAVLPEVVLSNRNNESNFDSVIPMLRRWAVYDAMGSQPKRVAGSRHK